jgi:hypothetical protein
LTEEAKDHFGFEEKLWQGISAWLSNVAREEYIVSLA